MSTADERVAQMTGTSSGSEKHAGTELARAGTLVVASRHARAEPRPLLDAAPAPHVADRPARLGVLVHDAGYGPIGADQDAPPGAPRARFEIRVVGLAEVTHAFLLMRPARRSGPTLGARVAAVRSRLR